MESGIARREMKKLGIIGGTGSESTLIYYKEIESGVFEKAGRFPYLSVESLSVFDVLKFCADKNYDGLAEYLLRGLTNLKNAGADFACLTGITPHIVFDKIAQKSPLPVVSMIETSVEEAKKCGYKKLVLLGTIPTMQGDFFKKPFEKNGIKIKVPNEEEMRFIGGKIETELESGKVIPKTQEKIAQIANSLSQNENADAIILGCTELPLILNDSLTKVPCLDVMKIHIKKLVEMIAETKKDE